ncbi:carbohydrate ABC transporter permease, partial [Streptomyces sp. SID8455]|nr:carbohydrate ABC transporter permease [Streptomyces sp. SID8455]
MKTTDTPPSGSSSGTDDTSKVPAQRTGTGPKAPSAPAKRGEGQVLNVFSHGMLVVWAIMVVLPLFWAVMSSFKTDTDIFNTPWSLPSSLSFDAWGRAWSQ